MASASGARTIADAEQRWDASRYASSGRFVADLGIPVLELLAPVSGEQILDLGCGDGALTRRLTEAGASVLGVDASPELVRAARARGVNAVVGDAQRLELDSEFDAVFSNAALHWMPRVDAVLEGVARALRPGGRFVAELGGHGNVAAVHVALAAALERRGFDPVSVDPWYFPAPNAYRQRLEAHGFVVRTIELIPRPTPLPGSMADWLATFAHPWTAVLASEQRGALIDEVAERLRPYLCDEDGQWTVDYVRLRFAAELPVRIRT